MVRAARYYRTALFFADFFSRFSRFSRFLWILNQKIRRRFVTICEFQQRTNYLERLFSIRVFGKRNWKMLGILTRTRGASTITVQKTRATIEVALFWPKYVTGTDRASQPNNAGISFSFDHIIFVHFRYRLQVVVLFHGGERTMFLPPSLCRWGAELSTVSFSVGTKLIKSRSLTKKNEVATRP